MLSLSKVYQGIGIRVLVDIGARVISDRSLSRITWHHVIFAVLHLKPCGTISTLLLQGTRTSIPVGDFGVERVVLGVYKIVQYSYVRYVEISLAPAEECEKLIYSLCRAEVAVQQYLCFSSYSYI
jgi:hypothetical protein